MKFVEYVAARLQHCKRVVEIGSRNVNGSTRHLFPNAEYIGVDQWPGEGVDVVADGATWHPGTLFDVVICCETLEHAADPIAMMMNLAKLCEPTGTIIITAAGPDRPEHSAIDGGALQRDEPYQPITAAMVRLALDGWNVDVDYAPHLDWPCGDIYAVAIR